jgi:hypothetical protein
MLPNPKIVIGGILAFVLLLAVTGVGIVTPLTYTRIGTAPEVSHPMMQRVFAEGFAAAALNAAVVARREAELGALRELPPPASLEPPTDKDEADATAAVKSSDPPPAETAAAPSGAPVVAGTFSRDLTDQLPNAADADPAPHVPALSAVAAALPAESAAQAVAAAPGDTNAAPSAPEPAKAVIPQANANPEKPGLNVAPFALGHRHAAAAGAKKTASKVAARLHRRRFHKQPVQETTQSAAYTSFGQSFQPPYQPSPFLQSTPASNRSSRHAQ